MAANSGPRGFSEETFRRRTGRSPAEWAAVLDAFGMAAHGHRAAARHLQEAHGLNPWWAQAVVIRYEWERGLRRDAPEPPPELARALAADAAAREAFATLAPHQQRKSAAWVDAGERPETRARRTERVLDALRRGAPPPP